MLSSTKELESIIVAQSQVSNRDIQKATRDLNALQQQQRSEIEGLFRNAGSVLIFLRVDWNR
jgi:hypothetical protein